MSNFVVTLTTKGREIEAQKLLYGYGFKVEFFELGSGGHDPANPAIALPITPDDTTLRGLFLGPEPIDIADLPNPTCPRFVCIAQPGEAIGQISNLGLIATITHIPYEAFQVEPTDVDPITDEITHPSHGLSNGDAIKFTTLIPSSLPGGLSPDVTYYVANVTSTTFQVSSGSSIVDLTSQGVGTFELIYGTVPNAPDVGQQFLYAISNFPARTKLASSRETFSVTIKT